MTSTGCSSRAAVPDDLVVLAVPDVRRQHGLAAICGRRHDMLAGSRAAAVVAPTFGRAGTTDGRRPAQHHSSVGSPSTGVVRREDS